MKLPTKAEFYRKYPDNEPPVVIVRKKGGGEERFLVQLVGVTWVGGGKYHVQGRYIEVPKGASVARGDIDWFTNVAIEEEEKVLGAA